MGSTRIFIISWPRQHEKAADIARRLGGADRRIAIVYSDPNPDFTVPADCELIRRPNDLFWEDKFKACLDACGDDPMLVIHADCECADWPGLVAAHARAVAEFADIGVWAPAISGTPYGPDVVEVARLGDSPLTFAALTDGLVFALSPAVLKRMREVRYGSNRFGWGIDVLFCVAAYALRKWVVVDRSVQVAHQPGRGYNSAEAREGMYRFLSQLETMEAVQWALLQGYIRYKYRQAGQAENPALR